jgi:hypothetical protein
MHFHTDVFMLHANLKFSVHCVEQKEEHLHAFRKRSLEEEYLISRVKAA